MNEPEAFLKPWDHMTVGLLPMKHSNASHCHLDFHNHQSLNSAIKAQLPKSKLNNNNMRLQKYAQGGWNIISSNYIKRCIQLTGNEESLFVNSMDYILKLADGYTKKSHARQRKPILLRQQNQISSDSVQKKTAIASIKKSQKN